MPLPPTFLSAIRGRFGFVSRATAPLLFRRTRLPGMYLPVCPLFRPTLAFEDDPPVPVRRASEDPGRCSPVPNRGFRSVLLRSDLSLTLRAAPKSSPPVLDSSSVSVP